MKKIFLIIWLNMLSFAFSSEFTVRLEPREPVAGETFQLIFNIDLKTQEEPFISFEPGQAEVLGRRNLGSSVQTTIVNGQVSTKRSVRYAYDLVVANPGILRISGITVEAGGETKRQDGITANVIRERRAPDTYFLRAEVEKTEVYVGEGLTLNYYLYFRVPIVGTEVRDFPKLNHLIKRFHLPSERVETIEVDGVLYRRQVAYSARIYPERPGKLMIDPLKLRIQYSDQPTTGSPFSGFGFQSRQTQVRNVQSEDLELTVLPLPLEGLPNNFTGLVGKHTFKLVMPRTRFLVNEPVEVRLEVTGVGALENMHAPLLFDSEALEQFDTMAEFAEIDRERAKKNFEYTYLARTQMDIPAMNLELNYFDPDKKQYISVPVEIPEITVSGGQVINEERVSDRPDAKESSVKSRVPIAYELTAPLFSEMSEYSVSAKPFRYINLIMGMLIVLWVSGFGASWFGSLRTQLLGEDLLKEMKKNGITYSTFYHFVDVYQQRMGQGHKGVGEFLDGLSLSEESRQYFRKVYTQLEKSSYDERKMPIDFQFNKKYFNELLKHLNRENFENY